MKAGEIFEMKVGDGGFMFFQFLGRDATQLHGDVIRVFKRIYLGGELTSIQDMASLEILFHAHVLLKAGVRNKIWRSVGRTPIAADHDVLFRISGDYGNPAVKISQDWWVWRFGSDMEHVGQLHGKWRDAEIGVVVTPDDVLERAVTGSYGFFHPSFD